jgi:hypothetical protein
MHAFAKFVYLVAKPIHVVSESADFVLQAVDDLVSLLDVHLLPGFVSDPFGFAFKMFGRFVHTSLVQPLGRLEHVAGRLVHHAGAVLGIVWRFGLLSPFQLFDVPTDFLHLTLQPLGFFVSSLIVKVLDLLLQVADFPVHLFDRRVVMMRRFMTVSSFHFFSLAKQHLRLALKVFGLGSQIIGTGSISNYRIGNEHKSRNRGNQGN